MQQRLGLLRRMRLLAVKIAEALRPAAQRDQPVAAHLQILVERLHGLVVEGVARLARDGAPQQRLVRIGKAPAAEIRHRVGLAPDNIVEDPEAEILQRRADAEDVVVGADDPEPAVRLQQAPARREPAAGEAVVFVEAGELIPILLDAIDPAVVRPVQLSGKLQIVGRVGEDQVDRRGRQAGHRLQAITGNDLIAGQPHRLNHDAQSERGRGIRQFRRVFSRRPRPRAAGFRAAPADPAAPQAPSEPARTSAGDAA